ncbi:hypothetical protein KKE34_01950 [Patescibacteria group bacterium]|nr:hypothetical protein [Patescibacteria group bacterium]MBU1885348.1 hypothetical protein [Patescibacteria group bacterium]
MSNRRELSTYIRELHHPDSITIEGNYVIPWENATQEQRNQYYYDFQGGVRSIKGPDTGHGKGMRNKNRPGRCKH